MLSTGLLRILAWPQLTCLPGCFLETVVMDAEEAVQMVAFVQSTLYLSPLFGSRRPKSSALRYNSMPHPEWENPFSERKQRHVSTAQISMPLGATAFT